MREGDRLGRYTLERLLARGGMGEVFRARFAGAGGFTKRCVVKVILPDLSKDGQFVTMFMDEARTAARLSHPGIVQVFDFGCEEGVYYLAMEYLRGVDLRAVLGHAKRAREPVPADVVLWVAYEACDALEYVHTLEGDDGHPMNLVHRDVSLSNLVITDQGVVKLLDFGIAKTETNEAKTAVGSIKGKFDYLSPEQALGKPLDGRSDLFSLGIVMYELLAGQRLFHRDNPLASHAAVLEAKIVPPSVLRRDVTGELDALVMNALSRDRDGRFTSAREMRLAVRALLPGSAEARDRLAGFVRSRFAEVLAEADAPGPETSGAPSSPTLAERAPADAGLHTDETTPGRTVEAETLATVTEPSAGDPSAGESPAGAPTADAQPDARKAGRGLEALKWIAGLAAVASLGLGGWILWSREQEKPPWWSFEAWQATQEDVLAGAEPIDAPPAEAEEIRSPPARKAQTGQRPAKETRGDHTTLRGELLVLCTDPCAVYVDGERMRPESPSAPISVAAGPRDLRVVDARTSREHTARVLIAPNRVHVEEVRFAPTFIERDGMEEW